MTEPTLKLDDLLAAAKRENPSLSSFRARERAADINVRRARSSYTPTLSLNTGINGFTSQNRNIDATIASQRSSIAGSQRSCFSQDSLRRAAGLSSIGSTCSAIVFVVGGLRPRSNSTLMAKVKRNTRHHN